MSKSIIGEHLWAEITKAQKAEAVRTGHETLKQMSGGLLDGSDDLREARRDSFSNIDPSIQDISANTDAKEKLTDRNGLNSQDKTLKKRSFSKSRPGISRTIKAKARFGLPEGFAPRLHRGARSALLEDNFYRLPNGTELIPQHPTGTLGKLRHLYALLTTEQYERARRGSVYIRTDGRVFDYSVDHGDPAREMFDTGYTIHDLERTGRYASQPGSDQKQTDELKHGQAAHAS